jgi:adenylate cyclase
MAFWNAPLDDPDHALHAAEAALDMLAAIDRLNRDLQAEAAQTGETLPLLKIGIGINTGPCVVGNMGSERRFDYSALGDAVNLASRLESASKDVGVPLLIGEATAAALGGRFPAVPLARVTVKGKSETITVSTVLPEGSGFDPAAHRALLAAGTPDEATQLAGGLAATEGPIGAYYRKVSEGGISLPDCPAR